MIIPAILPKNQTELNTKIKRVLGMVSHVQIDVCDGKFVPNKTQFDYLPHLDQVEYELDLMIAEPEKTIETFIEMQPARIIIHLESVKDFENIFNALQRVEGIIEIGLCISNDSPNDLLENHIEHAQFIQFMGISKVGFQGQSFDDRVLEKITYFHEKYPDTIISIDGDVNTETIKQLADAGATRFVSGSFIFDEGDVLENIEKLESLIQ